MGVLQLTEVDTDVRLETRERAEAREDSSAGGTTEKGSPRKEDPVTPIVVAFDRDEATRVDVEGGRVVPLPEIYPAKSFHGAVCADARGHTPSECEIETRAGRFVLQGAVEVVVAAVVRARSPIDEPVLGPPSIRGPGDD